MHTFLIASSEGIDCVILLYKKDDESRCCKDKKYGAQTNVKIAYFNIKYK